VVREGRGSVSLLQRALGIGYGRAARLIDFMAEDGIVGQYNGSQARDILITLADWERMQGLSAEDEAPAPAPPPKARDAANAAPKRRNIVRPEPWSDDAGSDDEVADEDDSHDRDSGNSDRWSGADQADDEEALDDEAADADYRAESA
jgi:DNA segregation ATPase FtsK/SpoIIIE, S-DNA-T family